MKRRRWPFIVLSLLVLLAGGGGAALVAVQPAIGAIACPACYGFADAGSGLYVEAATEPAERARLARLVDGARQRVRAFFGDLQAAPMVFLCISEACYRQVAGGSRGITYLDVALFLSPRGLDAVIATHELTHAEFHARIGLAGNLLGRVPAWFDEGLAVVVSDDRRYLAPPEAGDRCLAEPSNALPENVRDWARAAGREPTIYADAGCRVGRWLAGKGGAQAALALASAVRAGESFAEAAR